MITNRKWPLFAAIIMLFSFAQCKKDKEQDKLPPATQIGANTFGCLVNGKVYIPKGYSGTGTPNPRVIYDIGINGYPYLQILAKQFDNINDQIGNFSLNIDSITGTGTYLIFTIKKQIGFGSYIIPGCGILPDDDQTFKTGKIFLLKYDLNNRIISGTFFMKIKPANCDTLNITEGRFDFKL